MTGSCLCSQKVPQPLETLSPVATQKEPEGAEDLACLSGWCLQGRQRKSGCFTSNVMKMVEK